MDVTAGVHEPVPARIAQRYPELALAMTVRADGVDVPLTPGGLARAYPAATARIAVFVHGLCETERYWSLSSQRHHGSGHSTHGSRLSRDLGYTPVYLRYNTGLHVSENGQRLARLLDDLVAGWPVPVEEVVLVGHSMGGLVVHSACHLGAAAGRGWTRLVRHVVCLGTPHLGAPLEKGANVGGLDHFDLLNHPAVYREIHAWLARGDAGAGVAAGQRPSR